MFRTTALDRLLDRLTQEPMHTYTSTTRYPYGEGLPRIHDDGVKREYFENGRLSRKDGPAVEYHNRGKPSEYWIDGRQVTKETIDAFIKQTEENKTHVVYVDGLEYTVTGKQLKYLKEELAKIK